MIKAFEDGYFDNFGLRAFFRNFMVGLWINSFPKDSRYQTSRRMIDTGIEKKLYISTMEWTVVAT